MKARTPMVTGLALLPLLMLSVYTIVMREMSIAAEIVVVVLVRYTFAAGVAAIIALPLYVLLRRGGAAHGLKGVLAFLGLLNLFVLAHISATMTMS